MAWGINKTGLPPNCRPNGFSQAGKLLSPPKVDEIRQWLTAPVAMHTTDKRDIVRPTPIPVNIPCIRFRSDDISCGLNTNYYPTKDSVIEVYARFDPASSGMQLNGAHDGDNHRVYFGANNGVWMVGYGSKYATGGVFDNNWHWFKWDKGNLYIGSTRKTYSLVIPAPDSSFDGSSTAIFFIGGYADASGTLQARSDIHVAKVIIDEFCHLPLEEKHDAICFDSFGLGNNGEIVVDGATTTEIDENIKWVRNAYCNETAYIETTGDDSYWETGDEGDMLEHIHLEIFFDTDVTPDTPYESIIDFDYGNDVLITLGGGASINIYSGNEENGSYITDEIKPGWHKIHISWGTDRYIFRVDGDIKESYKEDDPYLANVGKARIGQTYGGFAKTKISYLRVNDTLILNGNRFGVDVTNHNSIKSDFHSGSYSDNMLNGFGVQGVFDGTTGRWDTGIRENEVNKIEFSGSMIKDYTDSGDFDCVFGNDVRLYVSQNLQYSFVNSASEIDTTNIKSTNYGVVMMDYSDPNNPSMYWNGELIETSNTVDFNPTSTTLKLTRDGNNRVKEGVIDYLKLWRDDDLVAYIIPRQDGTMYDALNDREIPPVQGERICFKNIPAIIGSNITPLNCIVSNPRGYLHNASCVALQQDPSSVFLLDKITVFYDGSLLEFVLYDEYNGRPRFAYFEDGHVRHYLEYSNEVWAMTDESWAITNAGGDVLTTNATQTDYPPKNNKWSDSINTQVFYESNWIDRCGFLERRYWFDIKERNLSNDEANKWIVMIGGSCGLREQITYNQGVIENLTQYEHDKLLDWIETENCSYIQK